MAVEQARIHIVPEPWGSPELRPWHAYHAAEAAIGEIWFERTVIRTPPAKTAP
jgi:mannose-6-phosphate isomerase